MTESSPVPVEPLRPQDPERLGAFELLGELGRGGMGVVFLARDGRGQLAAVKLIREEHTRDADALARFRREARLGSRLRARCVARMLDFQVAAPPVWLASEYVRGPSLRQRRREAGPLTARQTTALALGIAEALTAIHALDIVHRDLTDANIILATDGPRVIDFGIARALDDTFITRSGGIIGTPNWISPERWNGERGGPEADIFAWAVTVLTAATGRLPYSGGEVTQVWHRILHEPPDLDTLPDPLHGAVAGALDADPGERPTAAELCAMLTQAPGIGAPEEATRVVSSYLDEAWDLHDPAHDRDLPDAPIHAEAASPRPKRQRPMAPPFSYRDRLYHSALELASAMHADVGQAVRFFADDDERVLLRDWIVEDLADTTLERGMLRRQITGAGDAERLVRRFIAHFLPDGPPPEPRPLREHTGTVVEVEREGATLRATAERDATALRDSAKRDAAEILAEAQRKAAEILASAEREAAKLGSTTKDQTPASWTGQATGPRDDDEYGRITVTLPALGEKVTEGTVTEWMKAVGERVEKDEPLLRVETEKAVVEVPCPTDGVLQEIVVGEGETVEVGAAIAVLAKPRKPPLMEPPPHSFSDPGPPPDFDVVLRGYDRQQVDDFIRDLRSGTLTHAQARAMEFRMVLKGYDRSQVNPYIRSLFQAKDDSS